MHPVFHYRIFGDVESAGVVVARIEDVDASETPAAGTLRVLRLIELIPAKSQTWNGQGDQEFDWLVQGVLRWAQDMGCVAADYRCSSRRLANSLQRQGFYFRRYEMPDKDGRGFAGLLRPLRLGPKPINAHWSIEHEDEDQVLADDDVYLVKSDSDMDRPNVPIPVNLPGDQA